ncbi:histone deacetylase (nucleomorph) [Guillardia theta]|uniref:histone deacetylase n=1 Tax=Guillardia theta TaxID=55529 RepID=Q98RL4_GUITH|nr:histone deacetylase [Guillardia theta]AAK39934.1 histone deacetylase [Guillardia theta]|mmetsp:Transcript_10733/g.36004  ORF Transcript_10733/g.36004 Transcript_10733/m.36004 type:complete len:375 (-) Transcript_10733:2781-3905(-)
MTQKKTVLAENSKIGNFAYSRFHPMQPIRLSMTSELIYSYGMEKFLRIIRTEKKTNSEMFNIHSSIFEFNVIKKKNFESINYITIDKYDADCPIFKGLNEYLLLYSSASLLSLDELTNNNCQIAINWSGGLHHSKIDEKSGFCYLNDINLCILNLLKHFNYILYIDIDVHHGDGVEEVFYATNRVFVLSFHFYNKNFFPGSGSITNKGISIGKYASYNVPIKKNIGDENYCNIFESIVREIIESVRPDIIILQSGADSLSFDVIGRFNLSINGHSNCLNFLKKFNIPILVLGGGGYIKDRVSKCWTFETSIAIDKKIKYNIPNNIYWKLYRPNFHLDIEKKDKANDFNTKKYLDFIDSEIKKNIRFHKNNIKLF